MRSLSQVGLLLAAFLIAGCDRSPTQQPAPSPAKATPVATTNAASNAPRIPTEPDLTLHFIGTRQLVDNTNAAKLRQIWSLPSSIETRERALMRIAEKLPELIFGITNAPPDHLGFARSILDDLWQSEVFFVRHSDSDPEGRFHSVSMRISPDIQTGWETSASSWLGKLDFTVTAGDGGFEGKRGQAGLRLTRGKEWLTVSWGDNIGKRHDARLKVIQEQGRPTPSMSTNWIAISGDAERASRFLRNLTDDWLEHFIQIPRTAKRGGHAGGEFPWTRFEFSAFAKGEDVRSKLKLTPRQPFNAELATWLVPTNLIREPLISFSASQREFAAVQRALPWMGPQELFQFFPLDPPPIQLYSWGQEGPFLAYLAARVEQATNTFRKISAAMMSRWNPVLASNMPPRGVLVVSNDFRLIWKGAVIFPPYVEIAPDGTDQFLVSGVFGWYPSPRPAPETLLSQLRTNVIYYDWEITGSRAHQLRPIFQLPVISLAGAVEYSKGTNAQNWLLKLEEHLGNTITEATVVEPTREVQFTRRSHLGLNSVELFILTYWLDNPRFPLTGNPPPVDRPSTAPALIPELK